jgi:hypothetical protein
MYPNGQRQPLMLIIIKIPTHDSRIFREALKGMEFNVGIGGFRWTGSLCGNRDIFFWFRGGFSRLFAPHAKNLRQTYLITVMWLENFKLVILFNN